MYERLGRQEGHSFSYAFFVRALAPVHRWYVVGSQGRNGKSHFYRAQHVVQLNHATISVMHACVHTLACLSFANSNSRRTFSSGKEFECGEGDVRGVAMCLADNLREFVALLQDISLALFQLSLERKGDGVHME